MYYRKFLLGAEGLAVALGAYSFKSFTLNRVFLAGEEVQAVESPNGDCATLLVANGQEHDGNKTRVPISRLQFSVIADKHGGAVLSKDVIELMSYPRRENKIFSLCIDRYLLDRPLFLLVATFLQKSYSDAWVPPEWAGEEVTDHPDYATEMAILKMQSRVEVARDETDVYSKYRADPNMSLEMQCCFYLQPWNAKFHPSGRQQWAEVVGFIPFTDETRSKEEAVEMAVVEAEKLEAFVRMCIHAEEA